MLFELSSASEILFSDLLSLRVKQNEQSCPDKYITVTLCLPFGVSYRCKWLHQTSDGFTQANPADNFIIDAQKYLRL